MIALLTDFGLDGLYVGQLHALLAADLPGVPVIDLCHTIPAQDIRAAAYLIPAYTQYLPPESIIICVVDPGVGGKRAHAVCRSGSHWYIGPDNGIFDVLEQHSSNFIKYHFSWPGEVTDSFHARDVYTPAACLIAEAGDLADLQAQPVVPKKPSFSSDLNRIIYFDHFGNGITGQRYSSLPKESILQFKGQHLIRARTFSEVERGQCFWYENANGLVEIAANQGSARELLELKIGNIFFIT